MSLNSNSLAPVVGAGIRNVQFAPVAQNLPRKIVLVGTYDPSKTDVDDEVPVQIFSAGDAGAKYGYGYMLHRLAEAAFAGSNGIETWCVPQSEAGGADQSAGSIAITGTATVAGTLYVYIAGLPVRVVVAKGAVGADLAAALVAAITADINLPVDAEVDGVVTTQVNITAKSAGPWGDDISLNLNLGFLEATPSGLTVTIVDMTGGAGIPDIQDALDALGTGDDSNEDFFTEFCHGYGLDTTTLDAISAYCGEGNDFVGLYKKTVARPFRSLIGDVVAGTAGLADLITLGGNRKLDRCNGIISVPGSPSHPSEIAACTLGVMSRINNDRVSQSFIGQILPGILPGAKADRWTSEYDNQDLAVKAGVSFGLVRNGAVELSSVLTFYHPDSVPITSNAYRSQRNISIIQNILYNTKALFNNEKWKGISIVADVSKVSSIVDRTKARDTDAVLDDLVALSEQMEGKAWIYSSSFTKERLAAGGCVEIRPGGTGFNSVLPVLLSGEGGIFDTVTEVDTSLAVVLAA
jgi:phage tail sheath gpL-like